MKTSHKKIILFYAAVVLMFLTSMNKVLVPGAIFEELQKDGISGKALADMGAGFMYAYALSQLVLGLLASKYGGVRILLFGASVFTGGSIIFPFLDSAWMMIAVRTLTGLGAGTVFIALAKILADIFKKNFSMMLGIVLFLTYFGPVVGGTPMTLLVKATSWRTAMGIVALIALLVLITILIFCRGTFKPVGQSGTFEPFWAICKDRNSWLLFIVSSFVFGSYYFILTTAGIKMLTDAELSSHAASAVVTVLAIIVACNNIFGNIVLKLLHDRRKVMMFLAAVFHFAGTLLAALAFYFEWSSIFIIVGCVLIAIPAGFFSIFSTVIKEMHPVSYTGLAIAMLNFYAFVVIALCSNIGGIVFSFYEPAVKIGEVVSYPPIAYGIIFGIFSIFAFGGIICSCFLPETRKS